MIWDSGMRAFVSEQAKWSPLGSGRRVARNGKPGDITQSSSSVNLFLGIPSCRAQVGEEEAWEEEGTH